MENDATIAIGIAATTGLLTLANVGWTLFRSLGADSRDAVKSRLDGHDARIAAHDARLATIEKDEAEERGVGLPARVVAVELATHAHEAALVSLRGEIRSSDDKLEQILTSVDAIREELIE